MAVLGFATTPARDPEMRAVVTALLPFPTNPAVRETP